MLEFVAVCWNLLPFVVFVAHAKVSEDSLTVVRAEYAVSFLKIRQVLCFRSPSARYQSCR